MVSATSTTDRQDHVVTLSRIFAWAAIALTFAYLFNNYATFWLEWPGATAVFHGGGMRSALQAASYAVAFLLAIAYVLRTPTGLLRPDMARIYAITNFLIRASFWAVLLIGLSDAIVSFLRVEDFLPGLFGDQIATDLSRSTFRGMYVHFPMVALGIIIAILHRGLGFTWLTLLVVLAELLIVLTRFIFSYEQAFMADLVRFWYAALFLFASAYTLIEEGHVRVDVIYSVMNDRTRGVVNAVGSIMLGLSLCIVIIAFGMGGKSSVINGPLLVFETTQTGFGMYVKYWMAGFLGIFAVSMLIQFMGFFLEGIADYREEPGKREVATVGTP